MLDAIQVLNDAQASLRKLNHAMKHEVSARLLIDVDSLLGSIAMLEVDARQKDNDAARTPESYRHD